MWFGGLLAIVGILSDPVTLGNLVALLTDNNFHALIPPDWVPRVTAIAGLIVMYLRLRTDRPVQK